MPATVGPAVHPASDKATAISVADKNTGRAGGCPGRTRSPSQCPNHTTLAAPTAPGPPTAAGRAWNANDGDGDARLIAAVIRENVVDRLLSMS